MTQVVTELENSGVQDIIIACVDDLNEFPEANETVLSQDCRAVVYHASGAVKARDLWITYRRL